MPGLLAAHMPGAICLQGDFYGFMYIFLMINRITIVNIHVALMILYLRKNERIVIVRRAKLVTSDPSKNGLMSAKVKTFEEKYCNLNGSLTHLINARKIIMVVIIEIFLASFTID
ncbi:MAG: hypothetical protein ABUT20_07535 [Bacteroidota bacterium]